MLPAATVHTLTTLAFHRRGIHADDCAPRR